MSGALAIIGATGKKSGGYFTHILCKHKDEVAAMFNGDVRAILRETSSTTALDSAAISFSKYIGSTDDTDFLIEAFQGVDTVINIAGIGCSRAIVEAAVEANVRRIILVHTTGIYSKYKAAGEEYRKTDEYCYDIVNKRGGDLTILRPTMIYGNVFDNNVVKFIKMVDRFPFMPVVNGARYALQPVHYKDLGDAYYRVLIHEKETANKDFILSGGEPILLRDMLTEIGRCLGKKVKFLSVPYFIAYPGVWLLYLLTFGKKDFREKVQRLCEPRVFSHKDAEEAFGYAPVSFKDGIKEEVSEYKKGIIK